VLWLPIAMMLVGLSLCLAIQNVVSRSPLISGASLS
jgi:hypothetical protein